MHSRFSLLTSRSCPQVLSSGVLPPVNCNRAFFSVITQKIAHLIQRLKLASSKIAALTVSTFRALKSAPAGDQEPPDPEPPDRKSSWLGRGTASLARDMLMRVDRRHRLKRAHRDAAKAIRAQPLQILQPGIIRSPPQRTVI